MRSMIWWALAVPEPRGLAHQEPASVNYPSPGDRGRNTGRWPMTLIQRSRVDNYLVPVRSRSLRDLPRGPSSHPVSALVIGRWDRRGSPGMPPGIAPPSWVFAQFIHKLVHSPVHFRPHQGWCDRSAALRRWRSARKSRAAASPPGELLPATAQPPLHATAVLAATAAAAAAPSVRVREERSAVPPGAAAGRAAAERVQPQRYQVENGKQGDQYDNPPHHSKVILNGTDVQSGDVAAPRSERDRKPLPAPPALRPDTEHAHQVSVGGVGGLSADEGTVRPYE